MKFRVVILPQARRDIDRNANWWAEHHSIEKALSGQTQYTTRLKLLRTSPRATACRRRTAIFRTTFATNSSASAHGQAIALSLRSQQTTPFTC